MRLLALFLGLSLATACFAAERHAVNYPRKELLATGEVDVIAEAIQRYVDTFHMVPPLEHTQLFRILNGENPRNYHFLFIEQFRRNARGEVVDPWKNPYQISRRGKRITVASPRIHYAKTVSLRR